MTTPKRNARTTARTKMAAAREAAQRRQREDERDLTTILKASAELDAARSAYEKRRTAALREQGAAVLAMRERGSTVEAIAELTDIAVSQVRVLLKDAEGHAKDETDEPPVVKPPKIPKEVDDVADRVHGAA